MLTHESRSAILKRLLDHCEKATTQPLAFLELDDDVRVCPTDPSGVLRSLMDEFDKEDLVNSGVVTVAENDIVELAPAIARTGDQLIVLRDARTNEPFDLLTNQGCLSPDTLPVFASLKDGRTRRILDEGNGDLFAAFTIKDVIMLRASGLSSTLAIGLDALPLDQVDRFCDAFALDRVKSDRELKNEAVEESRDLSGPPFDAKSHPTRDATEADNDPSKCKFDIPMRGVGQQLDSPEIPSDQTENAVPQRRVVTRPMRVQLVFVNWSPSELSNAAPCQLKFLVDRFRQLEKFIRVELDNLGLWQVTDEEIEKLKFLADSGDAKFFCDAFLDIADEVNGVITEFGREPPKPLGPPADYPTSLTRLQEVGADGRGSHSMRPDQQKRVWNDCQRLLNDQVIQPLREMAMATENPVERTMLFAIANLSHVFHTQTILLGKQLNQRIAEHDIQHMNLVPDDQLKSLLAMADRLINITKATNRCNQPQTTIIRPNICNSPTTLHLLHSD